VGIPYLDHRTESNYCEQKSHYFANSPKDTIKQVPLKMHRRGVNYIQEILQCRKAPLPEVRLRKAVLYSDKDSGSAA